MELSLQKYQPPSLFLTTTPKGNSLDAKWTKQATEIAAFMENIAQGLPLKYATADSGLCYSTVCQWLNPRSSIHDPKFEALFDHAHARAVKTQIKRINTSRDWKAAAFWLERNTAEFRPKSLVAQLHSGAENSANAEHSDPSASPARSATLSATELTKLANAHERLLTRIASKQAKGKA